MPSTCGRTVHELAKRLANGELVSNEGSDRIATNGAFLAIPGISRYGAGTQPTCYGARTRSQRASCFT